MPAITDEIPDHLRLQMDGLRGALDRQIPAKRLDHNLVLGTWNVRAFGEFQRQWEADPSKSPNRDMFSVACIAEILRRFDIVAVQEVRGNLAALRHALKYLRRDGDHWGLFLTDVTKGDAGNEERLAFLFDMRKVRPSGLACELVLPPEAGAPSKQFARTPYAASFVCDGQTFILVTLHVLYGGSASEREPELRAIAEWLRDWAADEHSWHHNLVVVGDFNIDRIGDPRYLAFTETGLRTHPDHAALPATLFHKDGDPGSFAHYDQIAWFTDASVPDLSLGIGPGGYFDFHDHIFTDQERTSVSWKVSDHYPLWTEFFTRTGTAASDPGAGVTSSAPAIQVAIPAVQFTDPTGALATAEWVEVANHGIDLLDLSRWKLEDEAGNAYPFPDGFTLAGGETVKVHTGEGDDGRNDLYWRRGQGVWNDSGDTAILKDADGTEVARNSG